MALVLALVTVLIISALLGGVLLLSVSHYQMSNTNSDYANALNLAEAGVNWELNKVNQINTNPSVPIDNDTFSAVQNSPDAERTFIVKVMASPTGGVWTLPDPNTPASDLWIQSVGTVSRITPSGAVASRVNRTVLVKVKGNTLSGPYGFYALFGINSVLLQGNLTVNGASGTDGPMTIKGNSIDLNGDFYYCGPNATGPLAPGDSRIDGYNVNYSSLPEMWPTVNTLANDRAEQLGYNSTAGIDFFSTHNNNNDIVELTGKKISVTPSKGKGGGAPQLDTNAFQQAANDTRVTLPDGSPNPLYNKPVIVLNPGDYYFEWMDVGSQYGLVINNAAGPVNIWLGKEGATGTGNQKIDQLNGGSALFSNNAAGQFNIYEGSKREFVLNGNTGVGASNFYGGVYAYNGPTNGSYYGSIKINGNTNIYGSVIGYDIVRAAGDGTITFPSAGGGAIPPGEPGDFFGYVTYWSEP
jgi:hypothetical protein